MPRVLIFGAYANGNIGDEYQALSVARHLEACRPGIEVVATSAATKGVAFDFPAERRNTDRGAIASYDWVNGFSALVIGGGGLFASVHRPLESRGWAEQIRVPVWLFAVGATPEVVGKCPGIIEAPRFVSARDAYSLAALRAVRPDAVLLHDPILTDPDIVAAPARGGGSVCVIPRKMTDKNREGYAALSRVLSGDVTVLSLFPSTDRASGALACFDRHLLVEATDLATTLATLGSARFVLSERYHGCILALKLGLPCFGLTSSDSEASKIVSLYHQLGITDFLVNMRRDSFDMAELSRRSAGFDAAAVGARIAGMTAQLRSTVASLLAGL